MPIRIYDLARELKYDTNKIIKELQLLGAKVSVPSNKVTEDFAEKVRDRIKKISKPEETSARKHPYLVNNPSKNKEASTSEQETHFLKECEEMSFKELERYISGCLMKLKEKQINKQKIPQNKQTYKQLLVILNNKKFPKDENNKNNTLKLLDLVKNCEPNNSETFQVVMDEISHLDNDIGEIFKAARIKDYALKYYAENLIREKLEEIERKEYQKRKWWLMKKSNAIKSIEDRIALQFGPKIINLHRVRKDLSSNAVLGNKENVSSNPELSSIEQIQNTNKIDSFKLENLPWEILPKGEWLFDSIVSHFRKLSNEKLWKPRKYDESRLKKIELYLRPSHGYKGVEGFEGYVVYCFDPKEKKVVLECPWYGNATYIIRDNWKEITKVTKWTVRHKHLSQVTVINHSESWLERLKINLNMY